MSLSRILRNLSSPYTVGCPKTSSTCFASDAAAARTEANQEPSSILWAQMAAM